MGKFIVGAALVVLMTTLAPVAAGAAVNECVHRDGVLVRQSGTATCTSSGADSLAVARGDGADAVAQAGATVRAIGDGAHADGRTDSDVRAEGLNANASGYPSSRVRARGEQALAVGGAVVLAVGDRATAIASKCSVRVVKAIGDDARATASRCVSIERVVAIGDQALARVQMGDGNAIARGAGATAIGDVGTQLAKAIGASAYANASLGGRAVARGLLAEAIAQWGNRAFATGDNAWAVINPADSSHQDNTAKAFGQEAHAFVTGGTNNVAIANADHATAVAGPDNNNKAIATAACSVAAWGGITARCP